ncbi:amino acid adenylation domain-containing protein [Chryseobacterium nematophagum]|uniref:Amino acid adenylation domain-containing protein n=1 Tax=Chryseobacterium nematophagum TaxID=2305228 RepID=A0A3M7TFR2_9FLAO|nr:non-ribosomal peptide synthase/polyketide synthase [Chryseobacterium nematophagum]RNA61469.1 amino acid adenylation domain-containing protein [Chryseobacterium nematophagum]
MNNPQFLIKLTPYQESFYHEWMLNPSRSDYNMTFDQSMSGVLDIERLNASLIKLINSHLLMNSNVVDISDELYWKNRPLLSEDTQVLKYFPQELSREELLDLVLQPFDLEKDQLVRFYAIQLNDGRYRIVYVFSHIIVDGLSTNSLYDETSTYYNDPNYISSVSLADQARLHEELSNQFDELFNKGKSEMTNFWKKHLDGLENIGFKFLQTGTLKEYSDTPHINKISEFRFEFEEDLFLKVKQLTRSYKLTPYTYGQMILAIALHRISGVEQLGINYPIGIKEGQSFIFGAHVNTIIKGYHFTSETTLSDLIDQNLDYVTDLKKTKGQYLPIAELIRYAPTSDVLEFSFVQANLKDIAINYEGLYDIFINNELNIDLLGKIIFEQEIKENRLNYRVKYDTFELDSELVSQFIEIYKRLFVGVLHDILDHKIDTRISSYELLDKESYQTILHGWNATGLEYDTNVTLHELFERQVEKTPDHIALVYENVKLTYRELNERSNQLAHYLLQNHQIQPDEFIPLCLERSEEMLVAILGVLKSGGAYVPMDPNYPMDRIEHILGDSRARLIIVEENTKHRLYDYKELIETEAESSNLSIISLDSSDMEDSLSTCSTANPDTEVSSEDLSYVIYTSGTTGKPKGVMIEHKSVVRLFSATDHWYGFTDKDVWSLFHSYVFDVSVWEMWGALLHGGKLLIPSVEQTKDLYLFFDLCYKNNLTVLCKTPTAFYQFIEVALSKDVELSDLRYVIFAGEALNFASLEPWYGRYSEVPLLINMYGTTETTVHASYRALDSGELGNSSMVGKSIPDQRIYVLDGYLRPVPIGAIGELYIGGSGLSRGYLNLPELTAERFLLNPFQSEEEKESGYNGRMYKTGDLGRYLPGGDLEYIGRNDFQVKIRGYRIELGEIENGLLSYEGIRQSIVLAKENSLGLKYLVGYYVSDTPVNHEDLSVHLSGLLPEYMVPSTYVHLEEFPLTINGKLDRKALPEPNFTGDKEYIAPTTVLEKQLAEIYGEVLGLPVENIGLHDDFFRLGGNSIMAIKLISKIHQGLGLQASVAMVFSHKTIFGLAEVLKDLDLEGGEMIRPIAVHSPEEQRLSFAQERLWFIDQYEGGSSAYNIPMVFGLSSKVDLSVLEASFKVLLSRHEILRTLIVTNSEGVGYQYVSDHELSIKETNVFNSIELEDLISQETNRVFDLSKDLPISVCIFHEQEKTNNNKTKKKQDSQNKSEITSYISIVIHHIAFDGWSMDIFLEELGVIYRDLLLGSVVSLPSLRIQYKDFALWQRDYLQGEILDRQLNYWKTKLSGVEALHLPLDYTRPTRVSYEGNTVHFSIADTLGEDLRLLSRDLGVSLYSVMLGGYYLLLSSYSGQKDIVLGTVVANRHHVGLEDLMGFFVNTLVLREEIDYEASVRDFILQVSDSVSQAQMHQDVPFEKLVEELGVVQDVSRHPLFQVMFGLQSFGSEAKRIYGEDSLFEEFKGNVSYDVAKFDLSVMIDDDGESLSGSFNYARGLFKESTIDYMINTYVYLLEQMVYHHKDNRSELKLEDLSWVREEEPTLDGIFSNLLDVTIEYDTTVTIHELFERQVEKTPDHIALVYEDVKLTYRELNDRSNQLAHYLLYNCKIQPNDLIPLCLERSEQILIGMLGVLKSGGAYVPMDPNYPMDRIEHILGDTKARLVIVEENTKYRLYDYKELIDTEAESSNLSIISLNGSEMKAELNSCSTANPNTKVDPEALSYVIYTSGTTGKPKGVMIEHKSMVNFVCCMIDSHRLTEYTNVGCYSNYVFDVFVSEAFPVLCHGNTLWLYSNELRKSVKDLNDYIKAHDIEVSFIPPVILRDLIPDTSLQLILVGGEAFPDIRDLDHDHILLINEYGPTETTVWSTYHPYHEDGNALNIGRPITNTTTYVLDEYLRPVPIGAVGELYIGGSGLSRGYLNLPELTEERFLLNPFQSEEEKERGYNGRIYKTGDLVRFLTNGDLEYIGRNDFQIKIRGYRIELGEIENRLLSYEGICQAVVLAKEHSSGLKYLVGYYVSDISVNYEDLSVYLSSLLPEYMVPSLYVHLEEFPITLNGKLDRKALPEPSFTGDREYVAPTTALEKQLAEIYGEVLGLPVESIGLHDDFFRLGGNSIMAIKLISKIHQVLGLQVNVAMVFSHKTLFGLAGVLKDLELGDNEMISPIAVIHPEEQLLSFAQERLWFIDQYEGGSSAYNIPMVFGLSSKVDLTILKESFRILLSRHEILRTLILTSSEGVCYQYVSDQELGIKETDVFNSTELEDVISQEINKVFDLSKELPISVCLFHEQEKNNNNEQISYISIVIHHIAFDGWSIDIFLEELRSIYQDLLSGDSVSLPSLRIQYKDFALWQRDYLQGEVLDRQLDYWRTKLSEVEPLNLPLDYTRPSVLSYEGHTIRFSISETLGKDLRLLSQDLGVSLYSVMLSGYYLLLSSYSGEKDIVLGTVVANRHHTGLEDLIGFFVNTLVLREEIDYGVSIKDFILQVSDSVSQAQMHQDVPFEKLVEELGVVQDVSRHPIFQVMFGLQSFGNEAKKKYGEDSLFEEFKGNVSYDVAKFDLTVMIDDGDESLSGSFNYARGLFKESTINHMISTYVYLLEQMIFHHKEIKLQNLSWVRQEDYKEDGIFSNLLDTYSEYDTEATLHELFERQVEKTPDHIALVYEDVKLTYRELNERSNQLANYLLDTYKIQPDELIPLCLERSEQMLIAILGVLKSGGAYVPMDPSYPMDRIEHILGDTKARVVIGDENTIKKLFECQPETHDLAILSLNSSEMIDTLRSSFKENPNTDVSSEDLSYVIYTSGTTGKPKGVMIEHTGVINLVEFMISSHRLTEYTNVGCYSNYVFDAFGCEIFPVLCHGNTTWLYNSMLRTSVKELNEYIKNNNIEVSFIPPVLLQEIILDTSLKLIYAGGETFPTIDKTRSDIILINEYGPTETTVCATYHHYHDDGNPLNIGRPIVNTTVYVLDGYLRCVPIGAVGELYIGGAGLSRGYLNLAELTAERFLENPFQSEEEKSIGYNGRMYKTGDLVRYLPGGELEYVGRNDFQVKIRGYRIELGEIENRLLEYEGIRQAVVLAKENSAGLKYLAAYYVSESGLEHTDLSDYLMGVLPEYMVPSAYVHLEELPITINGKLDRRALPEPSFTGNKEYIAPQTPLQRDLAAIYGDVLGLDPSTIGIHDDFFRLGGNSIMAIKLISKIHHTLGIKATVSMVFTYKSVSGLSQSLSEIEGMEGSAIVPIEVLRAADQRLSFAQERLWFIDKYEGGSSAYNIPMVFRLDGATDVSLLREALYLLIDRHEILRTLILTDEEGVGYQQVINFGEQISLHKVSDIQELEYEFNKEMMNIFDLSQEVPIRVRIFQQGIDHYVSIVIHHIAFDGWSGDIFLRELGIIYQSLLEGIEPVLNPLNIHYKDFALWQRDYLRGEILDGQLSYWKDKLSNYEPLNLPLDFVRPSVISYEGKSISFMVESDVSDNLRLLSRDLGVSLYSVMLSGYYLLLSCYSGQDDIVLGTPVTNRHHAGLEDIIGFFVNTLVLREQIDLSQGVKDFILKVSSSVSEAQIHQDLPFEKMVEELVVNKDLSRHPIFQVMFSLQNFDGNLKQQYGENSFLHPFEGSLEYDVAKFDLTTMLDDGGDYISGTFNYGSSLFRAETMEEMISTYLYLLEQIGSLNGAIDSEMRLGDLALLRPEAYELFNSELNATYIDYNSLSTLHELFEIQVAKTPDAIALVYEDVKLTYRELNERSNQLAHYLLDTYNIQPDDLVPLLLNRSEHRLIGILGVLKAGGAYVPMDPNYPMDRIEHILEDTRARLLIGEEKTKDRLYEYNNLREEVSLNIISLNSLDIKDSLITCSKDNPKTEVGSEDLSYVIYTSGTTGKPKGVMIEHKSVINLLDSIREVYGFSTTGKITAYTSYVFDVSASEFFSSLLYGNELHLLSEDIKKDSNLISDYLLDHKITHVYLPPALLSVLPRKVYPSLESILYAGEPCDEETGRYWGEQKKLYNLYGPTESTIYATYKEIKEGEVHLIGKPITNTTTYVLDEYLRPVPVGAIGELYIGGVGLSRGYLNLTELTNEKFIANPYQSEEEKERGYNGCIYKTGDLGRYLPGGDLEYIGRNDFQVKIRGYRIELGEIESRLLSYEGIRQSIVLAKENSSGLKYLVGYYVSDTAVTPEDLSVHLSGLLPEYMVPSTYVHLEELPMTLNGKLDRRALPEPNFTDDREYIVPETALEKQLAEIYGEVLGLPVESIGLHDDFFRLGGNSIMAIKLISKIHQVLGLQVNVAMVFSHKTLFGLAGVLKDLESGGSEMIIPIAVHSPEEQRLSFAQERLWFIDQYEGGSSAYNIPMVFGLPSKVDLRILKESFRILLSRHEILRTLILTSPEGVGYQYVSDEELGIKETYVDSSRELEDLISQEITRVFDLSKELPISVCVFHKKEKDNNNKTISYISIVIHHIAFDGWSIDIFLEELRSIYQDLLTNSSVSLPSLRIQYKDFALWQRDYLQGEVLDRQLNYWKTKLSEVEPLNLPLDYTRPSAISYEGNTIRFDISETLGEELRLLSQDLGVSLYSVMLGGYYLLLSSYSGQKDIVLGTVVANRHHAGLEDLIGFFVNTLVLREEIDYGVSVKDFILQVSNSVSEAQMHQDVPFEKLVEELGVVQDVSRHPLFQVMFGLQSFGSEAKRMYGEDSLFEEFKGNVSYDVAKFDLSVMIDDDGESLSGSFNYARGLFKESTINHMISTYVYLLEQMISHHKERGSKLLLEDLSWIREEDYSGDGIFTDLLDTYSEYDTTVTIHELFERQVEKTPDHIALVYEDVKLTYRELNKRSNQLAHYLLENYQIQHDELIPLCLERSEEMLVAILGVLKSGGAYVPMDPNYPMDRIEHILGDSRARLIIVEENTKHRLYDYKELIETEAESSNLSIISLDSSDMEDSLSTCSTANPDTEVSSEDLSYVIYTSGTTGKPKGVMIEHKSVVRLFSATDHWYGFTDKDVWSLFHSYVFDVSVWEMWGALLHGGKLLIPSVEQTKDLYLFFDLCYKNNLTVLCKTPTAFYQFIEVALSKDVELSDLRYVIFAGEALNFASLEPWYGRYSEVPLLINMYGTTETTVHASYRALDSGELGNSSMVGKSIPDQRIYVLDGYLRPVPIGAIGELYIGGSGLSRGYLNLPELTSERFLLNPFQSEEEKESGYNGRMYKTGDLGRYLPGGDLEYIGRNDFQVKIRGYRIELGEIENGLLSYEGIRQSIVLAKENSSGVKYLVGYYVSDTSVNPEDLSVYLSGLLPEYMVPSAYVHLEEFPLTINGKLDRKALPEPNFTGDKKYIAPTTALEKQLAEIYGEVLGLPVENIGLHDDFFRLGGNSIMAIKLISKIHQRLDLQANVAMVFNDKTIFGLAGVLKGLKSGGSEMIRPIEVSHPEEQLLSFAQERLWFIDQYEGGSHVYNIPMVFGLSKDIDMRVLKESFKVLLSRHEILRTLIVTSSEGIGYQYVSDQELIIKETYVDSSNQLEDLISQEINKVFYLAQELPISVQVFHEKEKTKNNNEHISYISIIIHHIAFDGWSIDIFLEELRSIYQDLLTDSSVSLPSLRIQYKDFALWQREYLQGEVLDRQLDYWKGKLIGLEALHLPLDYARPTRLSYEGHTVCFNIPESLDEDLRLLSRDLGVSLYSVMLGGYYLLLSSYSGQKDIVLGTTIANRHHAGLEDLIGFFVNTLVLREEIDYGVSVKDFILQVSDSVSQAQMHQDVPFEKLVEELGVVQDVSRHPLFQVMFGLQSFGSEAKRMYGEDSLFEEFKGNVSYDVAKFDLSVMIDDDGESLSGSFNYARGLFKESTIDHMISTYVYLLEQMVWHHKENESQLKLEDLSWVREEEYSGDGIFTNLLDTYLEYDTTVTIHELFERQVERTPDHIALVYGDVKLSYRELNDRSNQLAHYLLENYEIKHDELISLCLERSEQMLIGILGVLKSGGAYVPMDPNYPMDRIEHILGDTKARLVIVEENTKDRLYDYKELIDTEAESLSLNIISLNSLDMKDSLSNCSTENPNTEVSSSDLSYIIYTSGTTGKPKGVMIEHRNGINLIEQQSVLFSLNTVHSSSDLQKRALWYANYVFDAHVWDVYSVLSFGHTLHLISKETQTDLSLLHRYIVENGIQIATIPPVLLTKELILPLDTLIVAGDTTHPKVMECYRREGVDVINAYGPTESTVCATYHPYHEDGNALNIGRPITNTTTYVLDEYLRPVPIGAVGELYIGGSGLSRGYLNLPELTEERFLLNPFQSEEEKERGYNGRIYKTGDLVRFLTNGDLEYIGRNDFQIKIRGYRIELGEIENRLLSYEGICQAVVLAKEHSSGLKYLVGYYVSDISVNYEDLSVYLSSLLPEYMVPSLYVHLEEFPITLNGKLDRKALPEPSFTGDREYVAPTTALEKQLAEIYGEVLGLPVESIGLHDDFFRLGGNSIMAIKLISKIHQVLGLQVNVAMVFSHKTLFGLAGVLKDLELGDNEMISPIAVIHPEEQLLSFAQERLWFIDQYEGGSSAYNIPMVFGLSSKVDLTILKESFRILLSRHEILRTLILTSSEGVCYQYVSDQELGIKETDVFNSTELEDVISQEINKVFDLSKELPISVCLFHEQEKNNNNEQISYISIVIHHIAFDGWSIDIFLEELRSIYQDLLSGDSVSLPSLRIQYKDFALWQRDYLQGEVLDRQLDYWRTKLSEVEPLNLPLDYTRPSVLSYEGHTIRFSISETLGKDLRLLSQDLGVSLYSVMLSGYYLLLSSYSGEKDIVLGTVVANRHHTGLEDLIGFFVNTLVLREEIDYGVSIKDFILQVSDSVSQAQMHQDVPFEKLVEELGVVQDVSRHPIFQVMFGLQSFGNEAKKKYGEDSLFEEFKGNVSYDVAKFDLTVMIDDGDESLSGSFNYARGLFKESTINHMISTYVYLLEQMIFHHKEIKLQNLSWVRQEDYKEGGIFSNLLGSYPEYDTMVTIHELFERQVEKTPGHIALVYEDVKLTYRELNERSNQLANYLLDTYKIQPDELIPLCLERSEQMLIVILGVLKSGGAYVPMDPNYPMDRIEHILGDTKARLVLVEENTKDRLYEYRSLVGLDTEAEFSNLSIISLNCSEMKAELRNCSTANPNTEVSSEDLSYVIYTSGTTGKPKGVMIEHKSVVRLFSATDHWYGFTDKDVWSLFHSYVFDVSVWEMWGALLHGGKLLIPSVEQTKDLYLFFDLCYKNNLTVLCKTPTAFYQFIEVALSKDVELSDLRYVIFAGEALNFASLEPWYGRYSEVPLLINMYGTTETTVHASYRALDSGELGNSSMVGKSIPDQRIYVLDEHLRPVPVGAVGELYIGGVGLSRGYLNLSELTDDRFLLNPFQSEEEKERGYNGRMYKTGDLGRYLPGGDLEYIGRNDFQVKIRGYRIELGEIENGLLSYEGIRQAVVLAKENSSGLKYLVGYYVSDASVNHEDLSVHLSGLLPEYMVPSVYVHLESLPLTINGKLDRKALPEPNFTGDKEYIAPTTALEKELAEIYGEVLGLPAESIGLHDDFFRLGGNSIMAIKLISKIYHQVGVQIKVADVFQGKTIGLLSLIIISCKPDYKPVVSLNNAISKPNMFLIHPGGGGCEVYRSLAEQLQQDYSCYGVDSYNLYNERKTNNLNSLATYYLDHIEKIQGSLQEEYILLGWSLGGQIALEIASILESKGHRRITVYLLDTILRAEDLDWKETYSLPSDEEISEEFQAPINSKYFLEVKNFLMAENCIGQQRISTTLTFTKTILLKATLVEDKESSLTTTYTQQLAYNNVDLILDKSSLLMVYPVNATHNNILKEEKTIVDIIQKNTSNVF